MQEEYLISSYIYMLKNPSDDRNKIQLQLANFLFIHSWYI
jgi:hypothetical protein